MITILEDQGQKEGQHRIKNNWFKQNGIDVMRVPLPVGDYILMNDKVQDVMNRKSARNIDLKKMDFLGTYTISVDSKASIGEIEGNIIGKSHARFRDECILAQNNGIKLYILVENEDGVKSMNDLFRWVNPRRVKYLKMKEKQSYGYYQNVKLPSKPPIDGQTLAKAMCTMESKYGVKFLFCKPSESASKIIELLSKKGE